MFCQQDRAILCRDCDFSIHKANEHTQSHSRFLLTGIKLSPTSTLYSPAPSASPAASGTDVVPQKTLSDQICIANNSTISRDEEKLGVKSSSNNEMMNGGGGSNGSTSSISEYLIDTLPGWHVEDFLDASSTPFGFYKVCFPPFIFFSPWLSSFCFSNLNSNNENFVCVSSKWKFE